MQVVIPKCYDSHTHFLATGQFSLGLHLKNLKSLESLKHIPIRPEYFRADWLIGFGWSDEFFKQPTRQQLDALYPDYPVYFSKSDGHVGWFNTCALNEFKKMKLFDPNSFKSSENKEIPQDHQGEPSGLFYEKTHFKALDLIPDFTEDQYDLFILEAQKIFHQAGFTFVRDLSMTEKLWRQIQKLIDQKKFKLSLDAFVTITSFDQVQTVKSFLDQARAESNIYLKMKGLKIFMDGSLGSSTAYLSENYLGENHQGQIKWSEMDLQNLMRWTWSNKFDLAVHTIGDQAADVVIDCARKVSAEGILGRLHLEHVQILKPQTIQKMKPLHITCHMQPSHWLADKKWLSEKISASLRRSLFPWDLLRKNKIPFYFGSDTPIEVTSLARTRAALVDADKNEIPSLSVDWLKAHSYQDSTPLQSQTIMQDDQVLEVHFDGELVYSKLTE